MSQRPYDLAVCYRIYPGVSRQPIFEFTEKFPLAKLSFDSFREALGGLRVKIWVLLDNCPPSFEKFFTDAFRPDDLELVRLSGEGNWATFGRQIEILCRQKAADLVYFAEDDYLYLSQSLQKCAAFIRENQDVDFVTPFDHLDYHTTFFHQHRRERRTFAGQEWVTVNSCCLTFMAKQQSLIETRDVFQTYTRGNADAALWLSLTKYRVFNPLAPFRCFVQSPFQAAAIAMAWRHCFKQIMFGRKRSLWVPRPALATHMERSGLAPGINWESNFRARLKEQPQQG